MALKVAKLPWQTSTGALIVTKGLGFTQIKVESLVEQTPLEYIAMYNVLVVGDTFKVELVSPVFQRTVGVPVAVIMALEPLQMQVSFEEKRVGIERTVMKMLSIVEHPSLSFNVTLIYPALVGLTSIAGVESSVDQE